MNNELKTTIRVINTINDNVNKTIFSENKLHNLNSTLKKFDARELAINKSLDTLASMKLIFNQNQVINTLINIHRNLSQLVNCMNTIRNATKIIMCDYEHEWKKINNKPSDS